MTGSDYSSAGAGIISTLKTLMCIVFIAAVFAIACLISDLGYKQEQPTIFTTSLTFSATNRLAVTHYVIIPATHDDWAAMTSRYPANVTRTVLNFK
jgi:hypothetical protein